MATEAPNIPNQPTGGSTKMAIPASRLRSGMFTNLAAYLRAGQPGAARLGQKIEKGVKKQEAEALKELEPTGQEFASEIEERGVGEEQFEAAKSAAERVEEEVTPEYYVPPYTAAQGTTELYKSPEEPEKKEPIELSEEELAATRRVQEGYRPAEGETLAERIGKRYAEIEGKGRQVEQAAARTGTESGREQLLRETFSRPEYSTGETRLDQLLVGASPESRQRFAQLRQDLAGEGSPAAKTVAARNATLDQLAETRAASEAYQQQLNEVLQGTRSNIDAAVAKRLSSAQGLFQESYNTLANQISKAMGAIPVEGGPAPTMYGVDPTKFIVDQKGNLVPQGYQLGLKDVLTEQDIAAAGALAQLRGETAVPLWGQEDLDLAKYDPVRGTNLGVNVEQLYNTAKSNAMSFMDNTGSTLLDLGKNIKTNYLDAKGNESLSFSRGALNEQSKAENMILDAINREAISSGGPGVSQAGQTALTKIESGNKALDNFKQLRNIQDPQIRNAVNNIYGLMQDAKFNDAIGLDKNILQPWTNELNKTVEEYNTNPSPELQNKINSLQKAVSTAQLAVKAQEYRDWLIQVAQTGDPTLIFGDTYDPVTIGKKIGGALGELPQYGYTSPSEPFTKAPVVPE